MSNRIPIPNNPNPQFPQPRIPHNPQQTADVLSEYAKACIRIAFWSLAAVVSLGFVIGIGFVFARGVLWFIRLSTEALGV